MKLSLFIATAISTAVLAAEEQNLDVRPCVCSPTKGCLCQDAEKSVQVLPDAVPKCIATRDWKGGEDDSYGEGSCGHAQRYADVICITSRTPEDISAGNWCGRAQRRADVACSASKRSHIELPEPSTGVDCVSAQKRAISCITSRNPDSPFPGNWCGRDLDAVDAKCGSPGSEDVEMLPPNWCGRRRKICITSRDPSPPFPGDWCGRALRLTKECITPRNPTPNSPPDWCKGSQKRGEDICIIQRETDSHPGLPNNWCGGVQKRANDCIVSRGWTAFPWDTCDSSDAECMAAAKRDLDFDMKVKRDPVETDAACDYSSRGGRRAVTPPHCMCPVERDEAGSDAVKRCRCGGDNDTTEVKGTKYHCMCLIDDGGATAPCACNSDVAFLSEVRYE